MIKLIASDLDGSLLNDDKEIHAAFWPLHQRLKQKGIWFVAASGRPYQSMLADFEAIKDDLYFITDNGSYIVYKDKEILATPLPQYILGELLALSQKVPDAFAVFCGKDIAYVAPNKPEKLQEALQYYRRYEIVDDLLSVQEPILKVSICDLNGAEHNSYPVFKPLEKDFKIAVSGTVWLDVTTLEANKGNALLYLQNRLGIAAEETLVFGDYMNDLEMMQAAYYSYAMKNAHPSIIKAARFTTRFDNNHNGVIDIIEQLCFSKTAVPQ